MKVPRWLENFPLGFGWERAEAEFAALAGVTHAANIIARLADPWHTGRYVDNVARGERSIERAYDLTSGAMIFLPWIAQYLLREHAWALLAYLAFSSLYVLFGTGPLYRAKYTAMLELRSRELTQLCEHAQATQEQLNRVVESLADIGIPAPWYKTDDSNKRQ